MFSSGMARFPESKGGARRDPMGVAKAEEFGGEVTAVLKRSAHVDRRESDRWTCPWRKAQRHEIDRERGERSKWCCIKRDSASRITQDEPHPLTAQLT